MSSLDTPNSTPIEKKSSLSFSDNKAPFLEQIHRILSIEKGYIEMKGSQTIPDGRWKINLETKEFVTLQV